MSIKIENCDIENCERGICIEGNANVDITKTTFINNCKDIELKVTDTSSININGIKSIDCRTDSITIKEYKANIENTIQHVNNLDIDENSKTRILSEIEQMGSNKDNASLINKSLCEVYKICNGIGGAVLAQGICKLLGWM